MSDFNLSHKSKIKERQLDFLSKKASDILNIDAEEQDIDGIVQQIEDIYQDKLGTPLFEKRRAERHQLPFREDFESNMIEVREDVSILSDEHHRSSVFLKDSFNEIHSEKKRLTARINRLNSLASDLSLVTGEDDVNTIYAKESFQDADAMDESFAIDSVSKADIHTGEGILTLKRSENKNLSENARVVHLSGNGDPGTDHVTRRFVTVDNNGQPVEAYRFINSEDPDRNKSVEDILDSRPDTIFEYQRINVPEKFKQDRRNYNFNWASSQEEGDRLRMKLVVELPEEETINWITLDPYYADNANGRIVVKSIKSSMNGFDYEPLYEGQMELNQTINATAQTYRLGDLFTGKNTPEKGNYSGQGVWSFPQRQARFIEFVLEQPQSYREIVGQAVYYLIRSNNTFPIQIAEPEELKNAEAGDYVRTIDGERVTYRKEIQASTAGWRYAIGIRDIGLMQHQYDQKSHFISKPYKAPRDIERLVLYSKEILPESYLDIVSKNNDWIQYEVSFDDMDWTRISPMHQEPLNDDFPPKILEVNTRAIDLTEAFQVHKKLVESENPTQVRLRITMQRPEEQGFENTTPIVEEVALKMTLKGEL